MGILENLKSKELRLDLKQSFKFKLERKFFIFQIIYICEWSKKNSKKSEFLTNSKRKE